MHLLHTASYITYFYMFRRTSAPSSGSLIFNCSIYNAQLSVNTCPDASVKCGLITDALFSRCHEGHSRWITVEIHSHVTLHTLHTSHTLRICVLDITWFQRSCKDEGWMTGHFFLISPYFDYAVFYNARSHTNATAALQRNRLNY
jgi:hypothetical protein